MEPRPTSVYDWAAVLVAALFIGVVAIACWINFTHPRPVDFVSYWAAARLAVEGHGAAVYDIAAHRSVEMSAVSMTGLMPFPYPPPFLLIVAPFGLLPFGAAFAAWIAAGVLLYAAAASRHGRPAIALAQPGVVSNGLVGQNGFLTSAIFMFGTRWLEARPMAAGAILGLMVIKPQLGLLLPVALVAGRHWRALAAAAAFSLLMLAVALLAFGIGAYQGFLHILPVYAKFMSEGGWPWNELASPFAFARYLGMPAAPALAVHGAIAAGAAILVWRAWRRGGEDRVPILAAATLLVPPYLFSYDALFLVVPIAALVRDPRSAWLVPIVWGLAALPLAGNFGWFDAPNGLPVAAIILLIHLHVRSTPVPRANGVGASTAG